MTPLTLLASQEACRGYVKVSWSQDGPKTLSGTDLGAILVDFGTQLGPKIDPKLTQIGPNLTQN